jgi:ABC-type Zn uptake system ZnuABC Zn-binding protein ZnuA
MLIRTLVLRILAFLLSVGALAHDARAEALRVVATVPDLADLARQVGGDAVDAVSLVKGPQDPHFLEARPSFVRTLHAADLLIVVGLELESGWLPPILQAARNPRVVPGTPGHLDASAAIAPLDVRAGRVDRSMGDVHPSGNPHYLTDPLNGLRVARAIGARLAELRPEARDAFAARVADFERRLLERLVGAELAGRAAGAAILAAVESGGVDALAARHGAPLGGWLGAHGGETRKAVEDHRAWSYFAQRFGVALTGALEPLPGIAPTTRHLQEIIERMKAEGIALILATPYFSPAHAEFVAKQTGARIVALAHQVGSRPGTDDYLACVDWNVRALRGDP